MIVKLDPLLLEQYPFLFLCIKVNQQPVFFLIATLTYLPIC